MTKRGDDASSALRLMDQRSVKLTDSPIGTIEVSTKRGSQIRPTPTPYRQMVQTLRVGEQRKEGRMTACLVGGASS